MKLMFLPVLLKVLGPITKSGLESPIYACMTAKSRRQFGTPGNSAVKINDPVNKNVNMLLHYKLNSANFFATMNKA